MSSQCIITSWARPIKMKSLTPPLVRALSCCNSTKEAQRILHMSLEKTEGIGDMRPAFMVQESHEGIAKSSQRLGCIARTDLGTVFPKADVANIVRTILNRPVPAPKLLKLG